MPLRPLAQLSASILLFSGATALAQDPAAADGLTFEEATAGDPKIALFEAGDDDTTVYMMGTVHLLKPDLDWETAAFTEAWNEAGTVFFEADVMSPEAAQGLQTAVIEHAFFTDGRTFADLFTEEERADLNEALEQFGVTVATFANQRPWFVSISLAQIALQKIGANPMDGMEFLLTARAEEDDKAMRFFETGVQQIEIISAIPDEAWATSLVAGTDDFDNLESYFAQMVGLWYRGDSDGLANFLSDEWEETPELAEELLYKRNEDWANQLETLIENEEGTYFVAVGAGHLGGEKSVQDYLAQRGYPAERVNP